MITIKDIAKYANVSVSTVSLALRNDQRINGDTRATIHNLAKALNYVPSSQARALQSGKSHLIGYLLVDLESSFFYKLLGAISRRAAQSNYAIIASCGGSQEMEAQQLNIMRQKGIDGLIVSGCYQENLATLEQFAKNNCPIVGCSWYNAPPQYKNVITDNRLGGKIAGQYLIDCGHRNIVFLAYQPCIIEERFLGLIDATSAHDDVQVRRAYNDNDVKRILAKNNEHTAFFVHSDEEAFQLIKLLNKLNLSIPKDVSIIGFDDMQFLKFGNIALTTLTQHQNELGERAFDLFESICKGKNSTDILIPPKLHIRDSVRIFTN